MNNIRYNPLFGTGDASSDVVNPIFGVARSNPLYGVARSNGAYPEDVELAGLQNQWDNVCAQANMSAMEAMAVYDSLSESDKGELISHLQQAASDEADGVSGQSSTMAALILQSAPSGDVSSEDDFVGPPIEGGGDFVGPPIEGAGDSDDSPVGSGVLIDQPAHPSAGGEFGVPDFGYGEYQGVAEAGYGEGTPADFQGGLEAAWDVLAGSGISADEYEQMDGFIKSDILAYAMMYVESNGADYYAAEAMVNVAFSGLASDDIEDFFEEEVKSSSIDREATLTEAFSNVFAFENVTDHEIYPFLMETCKQIEMATGAVPSVQCLTDGFRVFRNVGFTSYSPELLAGCLAIACSETLNPLTISDPNQLIVETLKTDDFCSESRIINTLYYFGKGAEKAFAEFCSLSPSVRADEVAFANFDIAQLLGINGSDLDAFALATLDGNSPEGNLDNFDEAVVEDIQQAVAPKVKSPAPKVTVTANDAKKTPGLQEGRGKISGGKVLAFSALGVTTLALGFFVNKLRKL
jgi:hypothetical protein